ncbi:hypothetical protein ACPPVW_18735 [Leifsonia sp. McL0607]|uniref:hypothetical protein n=1 Tax=Leifsonia sp. McL0607 TaxID=3415672 RepID=UPI003CEBEF4C
MTQVASTPRKRNRGRVGEKRKRREVFLEMQLNDDIEKALQASGGLSLSLYVARILDALRDEDGKLPVVAPGLEGLKEVHTKEAA